MYNEKLHQYRAQQKKRNRSDGAYGNQAQKRSVSTRNQNKRKITQNSGVICPTCGKNHGIGHVIKRLELSLVVGSKDAWFSTVQRIKSLSLRSLRRRIKKINISLGPKGWCFL